MKTETEQPLKNRRVCAIEGIPSELMGREGS
jgi:hypothetical protein